MTDSPDAARDLPVLVVVADRLTPAGQLVGSPRSGEVQILVRDVADLPGGPSTPDVRLGDVPTPEWLRAYRGPDVDPETAGAVVGACRGPMTVAAIGDGDPTSIGRAAVTESSDGTPWLGITALWTAPDARRTGQATAIMSTLVAWGREHGAQRAYVQVEVENRTAGAWYRRLGFGLHHSYRYVEI